MLENPIHDLDTSMRLTAGVILPKLGEVRAPLSLARLTAALEEFLLLDDRKSIVFSREGTQPLLPQRHSMTEWTAWSSVNWPRESSLAGFGR